MLKAQGLNRGLVSGDRLYIYTARATVEGPDTERIHEGTRLA